MAALILLLAGLGVCAVLLYAAAPVAEALIAILPAAPQRDPATVETVGSLVFFVPLAAAAMIGGALSGFNAARLGRRPGSAAALGAALGAVGVLAAAGYAWLAGTLQAAPTMRGAAMLLWGSGLLLVETAAEEIYFRGWLQRALAERWRGPPAVLVAAVAFAALHVLGGTRDPVSVANLFVGGLLFGLLALRNGGIAAAVAAHFAWNWTEAIGLGLSPNPGLGAFGGLLNLELKGAALWGGSEEGLNGSLAMTLTLAALTVPLLLLTPRRAVGPRPGD